MVRKMRCFSDKNVFLEFLGYENSDARVKVGAFSTQTSFTNAEFSLDFLMEEVNFVVTEICEFKIWDKSLLIALFGKFGQSIF